MHSKIAPLTLPQGFFSPWKPKVPVKVIFAHFFDFLHGWKICFTGTFFGFFPFSSRVHKSVSRAEFIKKVIIFAGKIAQNFSRVPIFFHGWNLTKIFTGKIFLSRALFGQKPRFFHGRIFFFHGKKKTLPSLHENRGPGVEGYRRTMVGVNDSFSNDNNPLEFHEIGMRG